MQSQSLTGVCTIPVLCVLSMRTVVNTSIVSSSLMRSSDVMRAQKVPERPIPSLQTQHGKQSVLLRRRDLDMEEFKTSALGNCPPLVMKLKPFGLM